MLILLTHEDGSEYVANESHIRSIAESADGGSHITYAHGGDVFVKQTPREIYDIANSTARQRQIG